MEGIAEIPVIRAVAKFVKEPMRRFPLAARLRVHLYFLLMHTVCMNWGFGVLGFWG